MDLSARCRKARSAASSSGWSGRSRTNLRRCWRRPRKPPPKAIYAEILAEDPGEAKAIGGLAKLHIADGRLEEAKALLETAPAAAPGKEQDPAVVAAHAALRLAEQASNVGELAPLEQAIAANPDNHQARFDLAVALSAKGERDAAADQLLEIIRRDRKWNDEAARKQLLQLFEAWGLMDPASVAARRKLSAIWF
jgi:putative thioredoxin